MLAIACVLSAQAFASTISITIDAHNEMRLNKNSKTSFSKRSSLMTGSVAVLGNIDGQDINVSQNMPATRDESKDIDIKVVGKNLIEINDKSENVKGQVSAVVKKSFGGKVKSISLSSKDYEAFYAEVLERTGMSYLKQLGVKAEDGEFSIGYELSDFECVNDKKLDLLQCDQDMVIKVSFSDEVKGRESILKEIDSALGVIDSYSGLDLNLSYGIVSYVKVLDEINASLTTAGYKPEFKSVAAKVKKIKDYIDADISDSSFYTRIDGSTVISVLNEIESGLKSIKKML